MRLALTFNRKKSELEAEAEFDTIETVRALTTILVSLGCSVVPIDVSCSIPSLVARLRRAAPDVVFNIAEGTRGPFREAFYPALFEQLGLVHTGSSASALAVCLDKALAKRVVAAARVPIPRSVFVRHARDLGVVSLPAIVKPNFEGSSKGITQASVVTDAGALARVVGDILTRYPDGVLVEEFVDGADVSVAWVEGVGLLPAIGYAYEPLGPHRILDLALKQGPTERIRVEVPAPLPRKHARRLAVVAEAAFRALDVRGYGRADFRVTPSGDVRFLEMNPLPTLADPDLYDAARVVGMTTSDLFAAILAATHGARLIRSSA
jgi:D-alanine-D-alanine ligase